MGSAISDVEVSNVEHLVTDARSGQQEGRGEDADHGRSSSGKWIVRTIEAFF